MPSQRKAANSVEQMLENLGADQREIVQSLRALVSKADPRASEGFKWSMPVFEHDGMLCYIAPMKSSVNFGFYESAPVLDDADGLLEGTGKRMRHVKLASASEIRTTLFTKWVKQAAAFNAQQKGAKGGARAKTTRGETSAGRANNTSDEKSTSRASNTSAEMGRTRATSASRAKSSAAHAAKTSGAKK